MTEFTVNDPIVLLPIQPAPLPYNYKFGVSFSSTKIPKDKVVIGVSMPLSAFGSWHLKSQDIIMPEGYSKLLLGILHYARLHNLWGQTIQLYANYPQPSGTVKAINQSALETT